MTYADFLAKKLISSVPTGIGRDVEISDALFPFQADLTRWALRRGRAAIFADTGLGKSRMQLAWLDAVLRETGGRGLILSPLAVAAQTVREASSIGIAATLCREAGDVRDGINVTNYDRLHKFDTKQFSAVVCDESSLLKDFTSATRNTLIESFAATPFKLACTATPAPNDFTELGNHAEFLGVMTRLEMLSMWFVHDGGSTQDWRLKGHARADFWRFVTTWGALVRKPSDLGYDNGAFDLPPLVTQEIVVPSDLAQARKAGLLFVQEVSTLEEQRAARRASIDARVAATAALVAKEPDEQWILWGDLNDECDAMTAAIPGAVQIKGSDSPDSKEQNIIDFAEGRTRVCVSKASICGAGVNLQRCARMVFCGIGYSFESYYQAVRRCWRFKQERPVHVYIITSEAEGRVLETLRRKQVDAETMSSAMSAETGALVRDAIGSTARHVSPYNPTVVIKWPHWVQEEAS